MEPLLDLWFLSHALFGALAGAAGLRFWHVLAIATTWEWAEIAVRMEWAAYCAGDGNPLNSALDVALAILLWLVVAGLFSLRARPRQPSAPWSPAVNLCL